MSACAADISPVICGAVPTVEIAVFVDDLESALLAEAIERVGERERRDCEASFGVGSGRRVRTATSQRGQRRDQPGEELAFHPATNISENRRNGGIE